jgi:hypothetical protein
MKRRAPPRVNLADLLAAAGEVAFDCSNSDKEAFVLAQAALVEILKSTSLTRDGEFEMISSPSRLSH